MFISNSKFIEKKCVQISNGFSIFLMLICLFVYLCPHYEKHTNIHTFCTKAMSKNSYSFIVIFVFILCMVHLYQIKFAWADTQQLRLLCIRMLYTRCIISCFLAAISLDFKGKMYCRTEIAAPMLTLKLICLMYLDSVLRIFLSTRHNIWKNFKNLNLYRKLKNCEN